MKRFFFVLLLLAIVPVISFAKGQSLYALSSDRMGSSAGLDTVPATMNKQEDVPVSTKPKVVKKVPKSRRQVKPISLPGAPIRPIIKPKIIKPTIGVVGI